MASDPLARSIVRAMKAYGGTELRTLGSVSPCRSLLSAGLMDRLRVVVFPFITGTTGRDRIYDGYPDVRLELAESRTFDGGLQLLKYMPAVLDDPPGSTESSGGMSDVGNSLTKRARCFPDLRRQGEHKRHRLRFLHLGGHGAQLPLHHHQEARGPQPRRGSAARREEGPALKTSNRRASWGLDPLVSTRLLHPRHAPGPGVSASDRKAGPLDLDSL